MKEFTCIICGETVSKRQSSSYQNGRACKTHSEVQSEMQSIQENELSRLKNAKRPSNQKNRFHLLFAYVLNL